MISKWYNTNAGKMAGMTEVSDEMIRSLSNGQVTKLAEDDKLDGTIDDNKIFGKLLFGDERKTEEESLKMGHIELGQPVVNIQYMYGKKPVLAKALGLSLEETEAVVYCGRWIVTDPGDTELAYKQTLTEQDYRKTQETFGDRFEAVTGAEAVEKLLEKEDVKDREYMILHCIPVVPLCMRYIHMNADKENGCGKEHYESTDLNKLYDRVLMRMNRLSKLLQMGVPDIIARNEKRMLQEYVDALISNGARGQLVKRYGYLPCESMEELDRVITLLKRETCTMPEAGIDMEKYLAEVKAYKDYEEKYFPEGTELALDDPINIRLEQMEKEIAETLRPFVKEYIRLNYARYMEFEEEIFNYVTHNAASDNGEWNIYVNYGIVDDASRRAVMERGIAKQIDFYVRKQLKWCTKAREKEVKSA